LDGYSREFLFGWYFSGFYVMYYPFARSFAEAFRLWISHKAENLLMSRASDWQKSQSDRGKNFLKKVI